MFQLDSGKVTDLFCSTTTIIIVTGVYIPDRLISIAALLGKRS